MSWDSVFKAYILASAVLLCSRMAERKIEESTKIEGGAVERIEICFNLLVLFGMGCHLVEVFRSSCLLSTLFTLFRH